MAAQAQLCKVIHLVKLKLIFVLNCSEVESSSPFDWDLICI